MKTRIFILTILSFILVGCYPTRIVTESARVGSISSYSTTVSVPRTHGVTTTTRVVAANEDISLYLDLQAVGAAFAQSNTIEEFENLLNNESYMLSNLDLNRDGYVDYLRVLETVDRGNHVFVIQAVLAPDIYQDVATLVAEVSGPTTAYVQIIGDPFIYGPNYIIEPRFISTPAIYVHLCRPSYRPWRSPWYWDHFPHHYRHPAPVYLSHYHAYIHTYMLNHHFCHEFIYAPKPHFVDYGRMARDFSRNDYGRQHPNDAFAVRNAGMAPSASNTGTVVNARDIRERHDAAAVTTARTAGSAAVRGGSSATRTGTATSGTTSSRGTATSATRSSSTATAGSAARTTSTTTATGSSAARTTGATTTRSTGTTTSKPATTRSTSTTAGTARPATSTGSSAGRTSTSTSTTKSRVSDSGSAETTIRTTNSSGSTSTTHRGTTAAPSSSSRTSGSTAPRTSSTTSSSRSTSAPSASRSSSVSSSSRSTSAPTTSRSTGTAARSAGSASRR